jgi:hypothetical protein
MVSKIERKDVLNVAGPFLAAYGCVAFFCFWYLVQRWADLAPASPDPTLGYIYPHNEHGSITYFSAFQATAAALLFSTSIPLSCIGMLASPKRDVIYQRGFMSVSAKWDPDDPKRLQRFGLLGGAAAAPIFVFWLSPPLVETLNASGIVLPFG